MNYYQSWNKQQLPTEKHWPVSKTKYAITGDLNQPKPTDMKILLVLEQYVKQPRFYGAEYYDE